MDIKDKPFTSPTEVAEALCDEIERKVNKDSSKIVRYCKSDNRFSIANPSKSPFRLRLKKHETSILAKLGFTSEQLPLELAPGAEEKARAKWSIGDHEEHGGRSLEDQRIRADPGFTTLRARFNLKFGPRTSKKRRENKICSQDKNDPKKSVVLHDGHLLMAEYLFSLVCLSIFRKDGPTLRMKTSDMDTDLVTEEFLNKLVTEHRIDCFTVRLHEVCLFSIGNESEPCSGDIRFVMDFVIQARTSLERLTLTAVYIR